MAKLVASFTSYGPRFQYLRQTFGEIAKQTKQPDVILLNIDINERIDFLNYFDKASQNLNIELNFVENLGPGKKLIPALRRYPEAAIITIDDDLKLNENLFMELWKNHLANPGAIIASRCHVPTVLKCGYLAPYTEWSFDTKTYTKEDFLFVTAGAGALFPPHSLHSDALDIEKYMNLSFSTDDAWYWIHSIRNKTRIVPMSDFSDLSYVKGTQSKTLYWDGNAEIFNDFNIANMALTLGLFKCKSGCHARSVDELLRFTCEKVGSVRLVGRILPLTLNQSNLDRYKLVKDLLQLERSADYAVSLQKSKLKLLKLLLKSLFLIKK